MSSSSPSTTDRESLVSQTIHLLHLLIYFYFVCVCVCVFACACVWVCVFFILFLFIFGLGLGCSTTNFCAWVSAIFGTNHVIPRCEKSLPARSQNRVEAPISAVGKGLPRVFRWNVRTPSRELARWATRHQHTVDQSPLFI